MPLITTSGFVIAAQPGRRTRLRGDSGMRRVEFQQLKNQLLSFWTLLFWPKMSPRSMIAERRSLIRVIAQLLQRATARIKPAGQSV